MLFWELSLGEITDCINAYSRRIERKTKAREAAVKDEIHMLFNQALQIGNVFSSMLDKNIPIKGLSEYYPGLFEEVKEEHGEDQPKLTLEMEAYKAKFEDFAYRHNSQLAKKRGEVDGRNDAGETAGSH